MTSFFLFIGLVFVAGLLFLLIKNRTALFNSNVIDAEAIILSIRLTGICIKNDMQANIQLQVLPERGKSFVAEITEKITATEFTQILPGNKILVKYNPRNNKDVFIIKESFSRTFKINQRAV